MRLPLRQTGGHVALLLCVALAGCRHQTNVAQTSGQTQTPNIFVKPPAEAKLPPMQSDPPPPTLTDAKPATVAEEVKPKKKTKRQPAPPPSTPPAGTLVPAPVTTAAPPPAPASATPPPAEDSTLGALAPGGDTNPKQQQEIAEKIASVDKRITDLPATTADKEQKQIAKVKLFLKEASDALKGGDVEGAKILATKAELLLDDLQKSS